jgi:hypothetical protein
VLYLALEDGHRRLQDRCRRLLAGDPIPSEFQYLTMIEPGRVNDTIAAWIHWHQDPPPLVILDTLGKILPPTQPGEDRYQRDYRIGTALKRIVDGLPGMTLLVNHHDRKANADDFVDAVSGTHGLAGAADTIIVLARDRRRPPGWSRSPARTWLRASTRSPSRTGPCGSWTVTTWRSPARRPRRSERPPGPRPPLATACSTSSSTPTSIPRACAAATWPRR